MSRERDEYIQLPPIKKDTDPEVLIALWEYMKMPEESQKVVFSTMKELNDCGEDGIFPHEAVRDCIEKLHSEKLVNGFIVGKENHRGVHSVTGGLAEKEIAEKYKSNANALRIMYSQTAAVLDKLSESYRAESLYEQKRELLDYRG